MLTIRNVTINDVPLLHTLIYEFAEYERELDVVSITETDLLRDGFGPHPRFRVLIAEWDGLAAGYALFFDFYSTWAGRSGLFLEDLFVRSQFRNKGIGKALLSHIARIARNEDCYGLRWEVLDWNQKAIDLYRALGGTFLDHRRQVLLTDEAFESLAQKAA